MDFGAGEFMKDIGPTSRAQGTPLYLAPEIFAGADATVQSDIYAVGVLLYYLVSGDFPVRGSSVKALIDAHKRGDRRRLRDKRPALSDQFVSVVERAIDLTAKRFASAGEMDEALTLAPRPYAARVSPLQLAIRAGVVASAVIALAESGFVACRLRGGPPYRRDFYARPASTSELQAAMIPFVAFSVVPAGILLRLARALLLRRRPKCGMVGGPTCALDPTAVAVAILFVCSAAACSHKHVLRRLCGDGRFASGAGHGVRGRYQFRGAEGSP